VPAWLAGSRSIGSDVVGLVASLQAGPIGSALHHICRYGSVRLRAFELLAASRAEKSK
jgi:hypothetical protein